MRSLTVPCLLFVSLNALVAQTIPVTFAMGSNGPATLSSAGHNFIENGAPGLDGVTFQNASGKVIPGPSTPGILTVLPKNTLAYKYEWGTISYTYVSGPSSLTVNIALQNSSSQSIVGLRLTPLVLNLPAAPKEYNGNTPLLVNSVGAPAVTALTMPNLRLFLVDEDVRKPLLLGFPWALDKPANRKFPLRLTIGRDNMYPDSLPNIDRPIPAGKTDTFQFSLRFAKPTIAPEAAAKDVYTRFVTTFPATLKWPDRRPIASLTIGTSNTGWATNPRGWFLDSRLNTSSADGIKQFQARLLAWADQSIQVMHSMKAQGMITWDIEGEQYPQPTTYIGDPRAISMLAPEMAAMVDTYFKKFRDAGFRVGLTIRPQQLSKFGSGYIQKPVADPTKLLIEKINYAKNRWGATLFYIDSNGDPNAPLDASVFETVAKAVPGILLIPEQKTLRYAAVTAPYYELRKSAPGTPVQTRSYYPNAFSVINIADGDVQKYERELRAAVAKGDILLFRGWFNDPKNADILPLLSKRHN